MSASPEPTGDLVAVACVVEASLLLASEWSRVLIEYVYPLLKRLNELHPTHQFRIAFVTYGAADTRPFPLLSKKYFAPLSQVTKELRGEPSKLGIGQTNSGSGRGMSALEGLVAAIELFDILMASANFNLNHSQTQSPQKDNRSLVSHLLHIAASPPDNAQRPQCNTLQHLDLVNWDSIPVELRKRKINLSLISLRKIPQFQNLQSLVAGSGSQSPWFNVHAPHILLLAGFPTPQKTGTKRQTDALPCEQSPDTKRQKVVADPVVSKTSSASPALPSARIAQNQRSQQSVSSQATQPSTTASGPNSTSVEPVQAIPSVPASTPATASPSAAPLPSGPSINEVYEQVVPSTRLKFGQMMERLKALEKDVLALDSRMANAQNAGQTAILVGLHKDRAQKVHVKEQIKLLLKQYYHNIRLAKDSLSAQVGTTESTLPNGPAESGPSTQHRPLDVSSAPSERPAGATTDEHKPAISDSQVLTQFWQSRGGTISVADNSTPQAGPSQTQFHPTVTPEVAAQVQKLNERKGIRPQSLGPSSQTSRETGVNPNATSSQVVQPPNAFAWSGTFSGAFPKFSGQVTNEVQVHVVGTFAAPSSVDVRTETWPMNFTLNPCKEPVKDTAELSSWLRRHQPRARMMRFTPDPRVPDTSMNEQRFQTLVKSMDAHRIYAYTGWQPPSGKFLYNIFIFSVDSNYLVGAVFPDGIPDLPGSGNVLDAQSSVEQAKPQWLNGINVPPMLLSRMQGLEEAKQKQLFALFLRQEQLRRQQSQQTQQPHTSPGPALNPLGMPIPPNSYSAMRSVPTGLQANIHPPTNVRAYNTGSGTVNYEMMQSFMQRNAEESPSYGMMAGGMNPSSML